MTGNAERGRIISIGSVMLVFLSALTLWVVVSTSGTWGYFSNTLQELASITTGFWDDLPGQSGTSINATKKAQGHWEGVDGTALFLVYGEICVTNSGEQPTENLTIIDVIQSKPKGAAFEDTELKIPVELGEQAVLGPGESHCYPYDLVFIPKAGLKYRNVAYVSITNHSGWLPGGHNCPGPELCEFGPAPKSGFEIPPPPDLGGGNVSSPAEYLPDTGSPPDPDAEGKLIELPSPSDPAPPGDTGLPVPTGVPGLPPTGVDPPSPTEDFQYPLPTPAPTQDPFTGFPPGPANPTPTLVPTPYSGPPGCTRPLKYWLNHPGTWKLEQFYLGNVEVQREQALIILAANPQGDASYALAQQYITALLNIASPADPAAVFEDLKHASAWFQQIPLGSRPGNPEQKAGLQIADSLEAYNLGFTGPGSCAADQPVVTPTQAFTPTSTFPPTPTFAPTMAPTLAPTLTPTATPAAAQTLPTPTATP